MNMCCKLGRVGQRSARLQGPLRSDNDGASHDFWPNCMERNDTRVIAMLCGSLLRSPETRQKEAVPCGI